MAKQPAAGRTKTRLTPPLSPSAAADLYEALLNDTIALVSSVPGVRLAVAVTPVTPTGTWRPVLPDGAIVLEVKGDDIGACLHQATESLFAAGFCRVMALNSDGPTLPVARITRADALLERYDVVLGPNEDGGYYLVGLRRPCPTLFSGIAWSTARVTEQTLERAAAIRLSVALLPAWYDVDTPRDLERLRADLAGPPAHRLVCTRRFFANVENPAGANRQNARPLRRAGSGVRAGSGEEVVG